MIKRTRLKWALNRDAAYHRQKPKARLGGARRFVCPACSDEFTNDTEYKAHYKQSHQRAKSW